MPAKLKVRPKLKRGFLPELIGYRLGQARASMWRDMIKSGAPPMRSGQFTALVLISENPGIAQVQLADELGLDKATIVALIDRLSKSGFVERTRPENDRRRHALMLTAAGAQAVVALRKSRKAHEEKFRALFSDAECAALFDYLARFEAIAT